MGQEALRAMVQRLRHLAEPSANGSLTDAQLLERFLTCRDEAAFEVLVWRHGAMVLGLCRRMLRHEHDAEDAFQATFLVLVRKASSIGSRQALSSWLYKVAYRVALAVRANALKTVSPPAAASLPGKETADDVDWRDLRHVLDEEVARLPEKYRATFVLCCLEGRTNEEAARQLGCPRGTVLSRLARARERLRRALLRRGVGLPAALAVAVAANQAPAAVPAGMVRATVHAAISIAAGKTAAAMVSGNVAALTQGVLYTMFMTKLKITLAIVLAIAIVGSGAGVLGNWSFADASGPVLDDGPRTDEGKVAAAKQGDTHPPPAEDPAKTAARRHKSQLNLKMIGLAIHNFNDVYRHFPPPAIYAKDGKPLLSWRVAILPYLEQDNLYKQFKLDEPWDSKHNITVAKAIPSIYAPVGALHNEPDKTYYQALVGKGAAFEPRKGMRLPADFPDGTSTTILVVEAAAPVFWTKPEDLPFVVDQALPKFGGLFGGDFNALFCDGSVHFLNAKADPDQLRAAITRDGGEVVNFDLLHGAPKKLAPARGEADRLPDENARLRAALQATQLEMRQMRDDVRSLQARLAEVSQEKNAKTAKMREENVALRQALQTARDELEAMRQEKARLERVLEKELKDKKAIK
jgi:RNA polymerase sigma factor (sigma-70 family)